MSRSIHDTWGVMERAEADDWSDASVPRAIVAEMRQNLARQWAIRSSERRIRRQGDAAPCPVDPDRVPVLVDDRAPHVVHPAGEADVRAVLRLLPPGSLDGLSSVRLCVDHQNARSGARVRDPFTGRLKREVLPGVFTSALAGDYHRTTAAIRVFALLAEPASLGPFSIYFRLDALKTLLHEAAHHYDLTFRVGRSRWDTDDESKQEAWARRAEREQGAALVWPYLESRYPEECDALVAWVARHGGVSLAPSAINGPIEGALLSLGRRVLGGEPGDRARVAFARSLHLAGENDAALASASGVTSESPACAQALSVLACVAQCGRRDFALGESLCRQALGLDRSCLEAWEVLARGLLVQGRWADLAPVCHDALSLAPAPGGGPFLIESLTKAQLCLGRWAEAEASIARLRDLGTPDAVAASRVHRAIALCWQEQWEAALQLSLRLSSRPRYERWGYLLSAVRFECAHRLRLPGQAGPFGKRDLASLSRRPFTAAWAARMSDLGTPG